VSTLPPAHPGAQLLLVDDDRLVLSTLSEGLEQAGHRVTEAESAEEAEALLAAGLRPDLAIIDVRMPGRGGLHLAQRLRELDHIPFMMFSAYGDPQIVAQATHYGALGYAVKPLDTAQLLPAIDAALARANELHELRQTREQLQQALAGDRGINIATGILMVEFKLGRAEAFKLLRDNARGQRRKLADLARDTIAAREALNLIKPPHDPQP
jgi:two-component system, response regulator PdtaR